METYLYDGLFVCQTLASHLRSKTIKMKKIRKKKLAMYFFLIFLLPNYKLQIFYLNRKWFGMALWFIWIVRKKNVYMFYRLPITFIGISGNSYISNVLVEKKPLSLTITHKHKHTHRHTHSNTSYWPKILPKFRLFLCQQLPFITF